MIQQEIFDQILNFSELTKGWDYGDGDKFDDNILAQAISVYKLIATLFDTCSPHPCTSGQVLLCFASPPCDIFFDIYINSDLSMDIEIEKGIGHKYSTIFELKNIGINEVVEKMKEQIENFNLI